MKTTKKLLVLCLIAVMGVVAVMPSTFSWFNHSGKQSGDNARYQRDDLPISVGTVTMETKKLQMDGNDLHYDSKGQKVETGNAISTDTVSHKNSGGTNTYTQYYRTKFTNNSSADAYVNFYLKNYTNEPGLYLGTIYPTITEKNQAGQPSATTKAHDEIRVYFQDKAVNGWASHDKYVTYTTDGVSWQNAPAASGNTAMSEASIQDDGNTTWYYDIPADTKSFYFYTDQQYSKSDDGWYRTTEVNTLSPKTGYYIDGSKSGYNHPTMHSYTNDKYVSVEKYYDTISISSGQRFKLTLPDNWYSGSSVSFAVGSGSNISINTNTDYLYATGNVSNAKVNTTITGVLGDTLVLNSTNATTVNTPTTLDSVPVIMNFVIPHGETKDVVWYIRNEGAASGSFAGMFFTK